MICKLCGSTYLDQDSLRHIFSFSDICDVCKDIFKASLSYEVFPLDYGLVTYYYVYEDVSLNIKQRQYLSKNLDLIYTLMIKEEKNHDLFVYLDDDVFQGVNDLSLLIKGFNKVFMFSLLRRDLSYKINF